MKNLNYKKILLTCFLLLLLGLIVVSILGVYVSGPLRKQENDEAKIETTIKKEESCEVIDRISFQFVTYTCETSKNYVIFDENGEKIATRKKSEAQFSDVEKIVSDYSELEGAEVRVGYGYEAPAYYITKGIYVLVVDFDTLEVIYSSGGK